MSEDKNPIVRAQGTVDAMKRVGYNLSAGIEEDAKTSKLTPQQEKELANINTLMEGVNKIVPLVEQYKNAYENDSLLFDAVDETMRVAAKTSILTAHHVIDETNKLFAKKFPPVLQMVAMRYIKENPLKQKSLAIKTAHKTMETAVNEWEGDNMADYPEEMVTAFLSPWLDDAWEKIPS